MKRVAMLLAWTLTVMPLFSQFTLSGVVSDENHHSLPGASLLIVELGRGTISDAGGSFAMDRLPEGNYSLKVTFVGYETTIKKMTITADTDMGEIQLHAASFMGEETIVTATRAGAKTPVAFSNMSREEIKSRNFGQDVPYLLSSTPSVVTSSDAGHGIGYTSMRIRGTDGNRINVTVNGVPLNDAESHSVYWVDLPDIATSVDNIQIQRGVGTSTNGAAAFGASVNFQTRKLNKEAYAVYEGTVGSFKTVRNSISAGTGLIKNHFTVDLRLSDLHSDGYIDRSWVDLQSYYVSAGYHNSKTLLKFITFSGTEELYQAWSGVPSTLLKSNRTYNGLGAFTDGDGLEDYYDNQVDHYRQVHYQLHLSRVINDRLYANAALHYTKGSGYYEQYKEDERLSDYQLNDVITGGDTLIETDLIRRKWLDNDFYGIVGGLHYSVSTFNTVIGAGWNRYAGDHFGTVVWARHSGDAEIRHHWYDNTGIKTDWNSYLKSTLEIGDRVSLFADLQLRGIDYSIDGLDDDLRDISQEHHYLFFNPKAGVNLEISQHQRAYFFVARANREPNRNNFVDADPTVPFPAKENLLDYEVGYAHQDRNFTFNTNLYFMDYTNQLVLSGEINDVGSAVMTNVKDSYRAGIELSGGIRLASWFRWDQNATFSQNKIVDYKGYVDNWDYWSDPGSEPFQVEETLGRTDLSFSPGLIFNNQFEFQPVQNLHLHLISRFVGKQFIDNTSSEERVLDPYFINDARISYTLYPQFMEEISLQLQVSNLFNVKYETNAWIYRYYSEGEVGFYDGFYPQAGTHIMAGIRLKF